MEKQTNLPLLLLLLLLLLCSFTPSLSAAASGDAAVISSVAKTLARVPANWMPETDPCNWAGIKCTAGRITSIDLNSKSISGTLPNSIAELSSLQNLDLSQNQISGPIPSLAGLSALQTLDLEANAFTSVPYDLFSGLTGLQSVTLDNNPLAPWSIPLDLAQCTSLQSFSAANTSISGGIPDLFGQLPALKELKLSYNSLTGGIPSSLAGSSIKSLYLNNQHKPGLSGRIDIVGAMPQLQMVRLQSNYFTGPIPDLSNLTSLTSFNVEDNQLTGPVPSSLTSCPTLKDVTLSSNKLQGPFPMFSGSVRVAVSKDNRFCNQEPGPCDWRVRVLLSVAGAFGYPLSIAISWQGNNPCSIQWTGVFCDPQVQDIMVLDFASMHFPGTISPDIANLSSLTKIILSDNNLTGPIPGSLTKLPHLQLLDVTNNSLTGKIPDFPPSVSLKASGNPTLGSESSRGPSGGTLTSSSAGNLPGGSNSSHAVVIGGIIAAVFVLVGCSVCLIYYQRLKNCIQKFRQVKVWSPPNEPKPVKISTVVMNVHDGATTDLYRHSSIDSSEDAHMIETQRMLIPFHALQKATNDFCEANILGRGGFGVVYKGEHNGTLIAVKRNVSDSMGNKGKEELQAEIDVLKKVRHRHLVALLGYCVNGNERLLVYEYMPEGTLGQHLFGRNEDGYSALSWKQRLTIALDVARGIEYLHGLAQESFIHRDLKPSNILLDKDMRAKVSDFGLVKLVDREKSMMTRVAGTFGYLAPEYATYYLNPKYHYKLNLGHNMDLLNALTIVVEKLEPSADLQATILSELQLFRDSRGSFGRPAAVAAREKTSPITGKISTKVDVYAFGVILMELITGRKALDESLPDEETHLPTCFRRNILNKEKITKYADPTLDVDEEASSSISDVAELAHHCTAREPNQRPDMGHVVNVLAPLVDKWMPSRCNYEDNEREIAS